MSKVFETISKYTPWVLECLIPAVLVALAGVVTLYLGESGSVFGIIFILSFVYLMLHSRRVFLRKLFITVVLITITKGSILEIIVALTDKTWLIDILQKTLTFLGQLPEISKYILWTITGGAAILETFFIDSYLADSDKKKDRKGLTVLSVETNEKAKWNYRFGTDLSAGKNIEIVSFLCSISVSSFSDKNQYTLQDKLKRIQVSGQFWGELSVENKSIAAPKDLAGIDDISELKFKKDQGSKVLTVSWDSPISSLPWYVKRFKPNKLSVGFVVIDNSKDKHYIYENFNLIT